MALSSTESPVEIPRKGLIGITISGLGIPCLSGGQLLGQASAAAAHPSACVHETSASENTEYQCSGSVVTRARGHAGKNFSK